MTNFTTDTITRKLSMKEKKKIIKSKMEQLWNKKYI